MGTNEKYIFSLGDKVPHSTKNGNTFFYVLPRENKTFLMSRKINTLTLWIKIKVAFFSPYLFITEIYQNIYSICSHVIYMCQKLLH